MHTKTKGSIAEAHLLAALLKAGKTVLLPFGDNSRYDLLIDEDGVFTRVQVKSARLVGGAVEFETSSNSRAAGRCAHRAYHGQIDAFGVYSPDLDRAYIVPITAVAATREARLRLEPAKNGQKAGVRMAAEFQIG